MSGVVCAGIAIPDGVVFGWGRGLGGRVWSGYGTKDLLGTNEAGVDVGRCEQTVVADLEELVR